MSDQEDKSKPNIDYYLNRREKEDGLLNTRTSLILITNSIAAVAVGITDSVIIVTIITISTVCIDALWVKCSFEASRFIGLLTYEIKREKIPLPDEDLWRDEIKGKRFIPWGPTTIIGKIIPVILLLAWIFGPAIFIFIKFFTGIIKSLSHHCLAPN